MSIDFTAPQLAAPSLAGLLKQPDSSTSDADRIVDVEKLERPSDDSRDRISSPPAPDGGLQAWLQVLAAHLVLFNSWGYINSFGIFQHYYVENLNKTESEIAWVGSVQTFLIFFVGTFSGRAMDGGYFQQTIALGLLLQVVGVFMTSLATQYWQLFLAQGICNGLGDGLLFCPIIALMATYFTKKRAVAISLQASGAATGGMVFPAIAQSLLDRIGFAWTVRVMGFVMLFNSVVVMALVRERTDLVRRKQQPLVDWAAFKELPYTLYSVGTFLTLWGVYFAYYYVRTYAKDILHVSSYTSFSFLLLLNGIGVPGRVIPAILADRYIGPVNCFIPTVLSAGILLYAWIAIDSIEGMWAFVAVFGYFGAGVQSLFPASLSSLTEDMSKIGVRIGMVFTVVSVASLSGPPIAGQLIQARGGNYLGAQIFGGTTMVLGTAFLVGARIARHGWVFRKRM
ncbi:MFS general substrate transporter [Thozetella sp. PMI_491]|nr:MFS general substrate transporter [Thozetella sp. PMI_491]